MVSTKSGGASSAAGVTIAPAGPGIFTFSYGAGQAIAYNYADGSWASSTAIPTDPTHLFRAVKINDPNPLIIYATGLGAVTPPVSSGSPPAAGVIAYATTTPQVLIGGVAAEQWSSPVFRRSYPGVYQLNVRVPTGTPTGSAVPLQIQLDGVISRNDVTIAVSQ